MFDIAKEPVVDKLMILNQHKLDGPNWSQELGNKVEHNIEKSNKTAPSRLTKSKAGFSAAIPKRTA